MRSRTFLNVSLGILALAAAYHFGARSATAQAPGNPVVALTAQINNFNYNMAAVTANGDLYGSNSGAQWVFCGNVFTGGPTQVRQESMGAVKARYR